LKAILKIGIFLKNLAYLLWLYLKRGFLKSLFFFTTLILVSLTVGLLLESNAKMDKAVEKLNSILPLNRMKAIIPQKIEDKKTGGVLSLLSKPKAGPRKKNFITPNLLEKVLKAKGVEKAEGILNVDFPMGVEFAVPGSSSLFRAEVIGIAMNKKALKPFLPPKENFKASSKEVPILLASYLLDIFNMVLQNNGVSFKLTPENVVGMKFTLHIGQSAFKSNQESLVNHQISCKVVGFIDMDYTLGIVFPDDFLHPYKKMFWENFKQGYYDSLMLTLSLNKFEETEKELAKLGFSLQQDTSVFKKVSRFVNDNKVMLSLFLKIISAIIMVLGILLCLYTIFFLLKDRGLEFSLYKFFGFSEKKIFCLYGFYLTFLSAGALWISYKIAFFLLNFLGEKILTFKKHIPWGFQSILDKDFLLNPVILQNFFTQSFILIVISFLTLLALYLVSLKKRL